MEATHQSKTMKFLLPRPIKLLNIHHDSNRGQQPSVTPFLEEATGSFGGKLINLCPFHPGRTSEIHGSGSIGWKQEISQLASFPITTKELCAFLPATLNFGNLKIQVPKGNSKSPIELQATVSTAATAATQTPWDPCIQEPGGWKRTDHLAGINDTDQQGKLELMLHSGSREEYMCNSGDPPECLLVLSFPVTTVNEQMQQTQPKNCVGPGDQISQEFGHTTR